MGLEAATHISDLVATNPTGTDQKLQGDDHLRMIKSVLKTDFPNINAPVTGTPDQLNAWSGLFPLTATNYLRAASATAFESRTPAQVRSDVGADNAANLTSGELADARLSANIPRLNAAATWAALQTVSIAAAGQVAAWNSGHASGPFGTFSRSGAPFADIGNGGQMGGGYTLDAAAFNARGATLELGTNNTMRAQLTSAGLSVAAGLATLGALELGHASDTTLARIAAGRVSVEGVELGFRQVRKSATVSGTLTAAEAGGCVPATGGITINPSVFAEGDSLSIYNNSASSITITQGASMTLRLAGTTSTGNRTLAARGICTLWFNAHNEAVISGGGLS